MPKAFLSYTPIKPATHQLLPKTSSGNRYELGEYCSNADHGMSGVAGGEAMICVHNYGWRSEPE